MPPTRVRPKRSAGLPERLAPRRRPRQTRSRSLVDAITIAAARVLADRGWDAFAMKDVAALAGVSPGSLYQYFPDKVSLVTEVIERLSEREVAFQAERLAAIPPGASLEATMEAVVRGTVAFQAREGALMREALRAMPHVGHHPLLVARVRTVSSAMRGLLALREPGLGEAELDTTTHVLTNAIHSLTHDGVLPRPDWLDDEALIAAILRLVRGFLRSS